MATSSYSQRESIERFQQYIPTEENLALLVLRTHLIIEAELNEILDKTLPHPEHLHRSRITFIQKLRVLQAVMDGTTAVHKHAKAIEHLNELRNLLAHQLKTPRVEDIARKFIEASVQTMANNPYYTRVNPAAFTKAMEGFSLESFKEAAKVTIAALSSEKNPLTKLIRKAGSDRPRRAPAA